jgi:hypothetical protein
MPRPTTSRLSAFFLVAMLCAALATTAAAAPRVFDVTVRAGEHARLNSPAMAILEVPPDLAPERKVRLTDDQGRSVPAQLTYRGLPELRASGGPAPIAMELHFIVPELAANAEWKLIATVGEVDAASVEDQFKWHNEYEVAAELRFADRPVLRYMCAPLDESTPERRAETYKPYHHVFSPDGSTLLSKGPGGLFPHHRGLFYGFNRISYGRDRKADTWHCTNGAYQLPLRPFAEEAGPVLGRHGVLIEWHGQDSELFARESRQMTAYALPDGTLIEFASQLQTQVQEIKLDGDPQHAGFQFRAAQEVAESTNKQTYYLRPQSKGAPGETLNWPEAAEMVNLPWHAMSCMIGGKRYTFAMLDHLNNPKESRFSERDYGRFGSYFEHTITPEKPLDLNYRVWVTDGETTPEAIEAKLRDFVTPVEVVVTPR